MDLSKANIPFVRFADDFLLFAKSRDEAERAMKFASQQLNLLDLELNQKKTQVVRSHPGIEFLGKKLPKASR